MHHSPWRAATAESELGRCMRVAVARRAQQLPPTSLLCNGYMELFKRAQLQPVPGGSLQLMAAGQRVSDYS